MKVENFFAELKRRNVLRAAAFYAASAWLLVQVATQVFPFFRIAEWVVRWIIVAAAIGFPFWVLFSWFYEWTPQGLQRESEVAAAPSPAARQQRKNVDRWIIAILSLAVVLLLANQFTDRRGQTAADLSSSIPQKSIAVLPFENLSDDKQNAYFAEGVQDEILTRLAKVSDLKVISRTSTQQFKSASANLGEIAKQLGVANILEGSVQKSTDQVRVNVQLINATTNAHLWAEIYDRKLSDIFAVQSDIAKTVADTLQARLTGSEKVAIAKKPTANPEAYELYLQGRHFWNRRTEPDIKKALELFQQAIEKDPAYALAYAGVADCNSVIVNYTNDPPKPYIERSIPAARRATELDDSLAEAHTALANALGADLQLAGAEAAFKRAFALNSNYASAHQWYGEVLQSLGRFEEAIAELRRARELDPLSLIINAILAGTYYSAGRDEEAWQQIRRTFDLEADFNVAHWVRGQLHERKGDLDQAVADYNKSLPSDTAQAAIACLYARSGRRGEAEKILQELVNESQRRFVSSYALAQIRATLGNRDEALRLLEKAYEERTIPVGGGGIGGPKIDNRFDSLRGDPRFEKFVAKFMVETK